MKMLVLGGSGMLGHKVFQAAISRRLDAACTVSRSLEEPLCKRIDLFRQGRVIDQVDAMDFPRLREVLEAERPDFIVNCIGVIKQREAAKAAIPSITLNSLLPHKLAEWAGGWGGRLITFSTDCVFSGKTGGYTEASPSDAEDLYGKSKYLGEVAAANALTLRTSIIGRELANFRSLLEWFLSQRGKRVRGYRRVIYSGVTTNHLAELVCRIAAERPGLSGLYQVTAPAISKHDLLCMIRDAYRLDIDIVPDDAEASDRSMIGEAFLRATGYQAPGWPGLIAQLAEDPTPYEKWR
jgi:dTDP-4-dehydrorhamnose reductase